MRRTFRISNVLCKEVTTQNPKLVADKVIVAENSSLTLTCILPRAVVPTAWLRNGLGSILRTGFLEGKCVSDPSPLPEGFNYACVNATLTTLTILRVNLSHDGDRWQCSVNTDGGVSTFSNNITIHVQAQQPILQPAPTTTVMEGQNLTLVCSYTGSVTITDVIWNENGRSLGVMRVLPANPCALYSDLRNTSEYSSQCRGNNVFAVTIIRVNRSRNNTFWNCEMLVGETYVSTLKTSIQVNVSINDLQISPTFDPVLLIVNQRTTFKCTSDFGSPSPSIFWFKDNATEEATSILQLPR
ncbi:hypothetical protein DPMN_128077 [Dreissena polymorpha]|uniref:Ig-like domain-containing protein n=1 Tax=Dreissena polymorpha TaxID=45954 RepID=A0A9D4H364_DREPO|nr:hypothetical protein DPMN_128077 [Dreissena polymorpha]